jgi:hypothetical protein
MGIPIKPSRNLTTNGGIAIKKAGHAQQSVEHLMWRGPNILDAAAQSAYPRHVWVLLGAGVLTGLGQLALQRLSSDPAARVQQTTESATDLRIGILPRGSNHHQNPLA